MVISMKALISSIEPIQTGYRVAQVEQDANIFPVAEGLFWVNCADDVVADRYWYDPSNQTINPVPVPTEATTIPVTDTGAAGG